MTYRDLEWKLAARLLDHFDMSEAYAMEIATHLAPVVEQHIEGERRARHSDGVVHPSFGELKQIWSGWWYMRDGETPEQHAARIKADPRWKQ